MHRIWEHSLAPQIGAEAGKGDFKPYLLHFPNEYVIIYKKSDRRKKYRSPRLTISHTEH